MQHKSMSGPLTNHFSEPGQRDVIAIHASPWTESLSLAVGRHYAACVADVCFVRHNRGNRKVADMRDMTLLDTGCLAGLLLFSLILPLMLSLRAPRRLALRRL